MRCQALAGLLPADPSCELLRRLPHGQVCATVGTLQARDLERRLSPGPRPDRPRGSALVAARGWAPVSKLAPARALDRRHGGALLGAMGPRSPTAVPRSGRPPWMGWSRVRDASHARWPTVPCRAGTRGLYAVTSSYVAGRG